MIEKTDGPKIIENWKQDEGIWVLKHWITPVVMDAPTQIAKIYVPPMNTDVFLNYLEWKYLR